MKNAVPPRYQAFTIRHTGLASRILTQVDISPAFDPTYPPDPPLSSLRLSALWDTGATGSVITTTTAQRLQLAPVGLVNVNHAGGTSQSNTYMVNIVLPNAVRVVGVLVHECSDTGDFDVIIGMDIISQGDFSITNVEGKTVLSFCYPSRGTIDYVVQINKEAFAGIGRNDPCPCGMMDQHGRRIKFKFCHGK